MDTETSELIERINARIDALEISLRAEIRGESSSLRAHLQAELSALRAGLQAESSLLRAEIRTESSSVRSELRAEFREGFAENRRHTEVLYESLRDDIRILADGFATMSTKLDSLQR